eukprot:TRINITY_DN1554_c0_g2_i1.p1 TRINITY_DN1554_c0_g2~~TRINITY_DN1554_c0_g2_i1.p1  ORF type:complete len:237 (+),score=28.78 TRINITY_DN1554_c0_g2_i1:168-878(+)
MSQNGQNADKNKDNRNRITEYMWHSDSEDPLRLVQCQDFPNFKIPFHLEIHSNAVFLIDFHSHLSNNEVIGFLGGEWDPKRMVIRVIRAYPCKALDVGQDDKNVEIEPTSLVTVTKEIKNDGLRVVGWYHSHTTFQPDPSQRDIENQNNYQVLFRDEETKTEPFIGVIDAAYDIRLPTCSSVFNFFWIMNKSIPMKLLFSPHFNERLTAYDYKAMKKPTEPILMRFGDSIQRKRNL